MSLEQAAGSSIIHEFAVPLRSSKVAAVPVRDKHRNDEDDQGLQSDRTMASASSASWRSGNRMSITNQVRATFERQVDEKEERMASTREVLEHHLKCFGEGDLTGILSDYAANSVMLTPAGPVKGVDAMRAFFKAIFAEFAKPGMTFSMTRQFIEGDYAYILWTAETADNAYEGVMDTFVVRDGKILAHSFGGKITRKH